MYLGHTADIPHIYTIHSHVAQRRQQLLYCTRWMFTLTQNIQMSSLSLFFSTSSLHWLLSDGCSTGSSRRRRSKRWHQPTVESLPWLFCLDPVSSHHVATATANITPCHKVLRACVRACVRDVTVSEQEAV